MNVRKIISPEQTGLLSFEYLQQPTVNLLVTSHFLDTIACELEQSKRLEVGASNEDVRRYIHGRISREYRLLRHIQKDAELGEAIVRTVVGNARKMYVPTISVTI
jgi:hypothetical protein